MPLTKGEAVKVAGKVVIRVGEALDDAATPNEITKEELGQILQTALAEAIAEITD